MLARFAAHYGVIAAVVLVWGAIHPGSLSGALLLAVAGGLFFAPEALGAAIKFLLLGPMVINARDNERHAILDAIEEEQYLDWCADQARTEKRSKWKDYFDDVVVDIDEEETPF